MKWVEIASYNSKKRCEALSDWLNKEGVSNQLSFVECAPGDFLEKIEDCKANYDAIRIGQGLGEVCSQMFTKNTVTNEILKVTDCLVYADNDWWPRCTNYLALNHLVNSIGSTVKLDAPILVVGAGAAARIAIATFVKLGIKHVNISNLFDQQANELIIDLKSKYFGVEFKFVPKDELVMLPGTNGVIINTTPFSEKNEILPELYYFNFLTPKGVAVDFTIDPAVTPLLIEARDIGATTVSGYEISALADYYWVKETFKYQLDVENYRLHLKSLFHKPELSVVESKTEDSSNTK